MEVEDPGVAGLEEEKTRLMNDQEEERALEGMSLRREVGCEGGRGESGSLRFLEWRREEEVVKMKQPR